MLETVIYGIKYVAGNKILKKHTPLIAGLVITNKCNLRCLHCRVIERKTNDMQFEEIASILDAFSLATSADTVFISIDGLKKTNDICRIYESKDIYECCTFSLNLGLQADSAAFCNEYNPLSNFIQKDIKLLK